MPAMPATFGLEAREVFLFWNSLRPPVTKLPQCRKIHENTLFWLAVILNCRFNLAHSFEIG